MSGIELSRAIRADPELRGLTVLALISSTEEGRHLRKQGPGFSGYLSTGDLSPLLAQLRAPRPRQPPAHAPEPPC